MLSGFLNRIGERLSRFRFARKVARSWFELTIGEQRAILLILGLFLLGVSVRWWHAQNRPPPDPGGSVVGRSAVALRSSEEAEADSRLSAVGGWGTNSTATGSGPSSPRPSPLVPSSAAGRRTKRVTSHQ